MSTFMSICMSTFTSTLTMNVDENKLEYKPLFCDYRVR